MPNYCFRKSRRYRHDNITKSVDEWTDLAFRGKLLDWVRQSEPSLEYWMLIWYTIRMQLALINEPGNQ